MPSPMNMPKRRIEHPVTPVGSPTLTPNVEPTLDEDGDLPLCMQPGWDPLTPAREAQQRYEEACIAEGVAIEFTERF